MKKACLLLLVVLFTVCNFSYTFAEEKINPPVLIKKVKLIYPKYALKNKFTMPANRGRLLYFITALQKKRTLF